MYNNVVHDFNRDLSNSDGLLVVYSVHEKSVDEKVAACCCFLKNIQHVTYEKKIV